MSTGRIINLLAAAIVSLSCIFCWTLPAEALIFPDILKTITLDSNWDGKLSNKRESKQVEFYKVKPGDTLWEIARIFGVDWRQVARANGVKEGEYIFAGQKLKIPVDAEKTYVVKPGDSLWKIARAFGTDVHSLAAANRIGDPGRLRVGRRLVIPESAAVVAHARGRGTAHRGGSLWNWPVKGPITSRFGPRGGEFHHGLDIAADAGTRIFPVRDGRVVFAGWLNGIYGKVVIIRHGGDVESLYAHNLKNLVSEGDYVTSQKPIALVGSTGRTTGPHVHLEIHVDGKPVDPQKYLDSE